MIDITPRQMLMFWDELHSCMQNKNSYGGHIAEIYMHTVMPKQSPFQTAKEEIESYKDGCKTLYDLCIMFQELHSVHILVAERSDGELDPLEELLNVTWTHRVHLAVKKKRN